MLNIANLNLQIKKNQILKDISFCLSPNQTLGIIGKSGSGKSSLARAILGLVHGVSWQKLEILGNKILTQNDFLRIRQDVFLIFQESQSSFHPFLDIGAQFEITIKSHFNENSKDLKRRSFEQFDRLGLKDLDLIWHSYPQQLSGGMAQRVQIALALLLKSKIIICDEITSSLDEDNQNKIIENLKQIQNDANFIFISHDLIFLKNFLTDLIVLNNGVIHKVLTKSQFENLDILEVLGADDACS